MTRQHTQRRTGPGRLRWSGIGLAIAAAGAITWLVVARPANDPPGAVPQTIATRQTAASTELPTVDVFKDPNCGCCSKWVEHLQAAGFVVRTTETSDLMAVKRARGVPGPLQSCHTAIVDGYVIEGHVPVADLQRLLETRPDVAGLAVPGMPVGSPGMEMPGAGVEPYNVLAFDAAGQVDVFARHR